MTCDLIPIGHMTRCHACGQVIEHAPARDPDAAICATARGRIALALDGAHLDTWRLFAALFRPTPIWHVTELAAVLGVNHRTLVSRGRRMGLRSFKRTIVDALVVRFAALVEDPTGRSCARAWVDLGCSSPQHANRMVQVYWRCAQTEIRRRWPASRALGYFMRTNILPYRETLRSQQLLFPVPPRTPRMIGAAGASPSIPERIA